MAFSIHFVIHIAQGIIIRGYVPGLVSSILMLPYAYFGVLRICEDVSGNKLVLLSVLGVVAMLVNLRLAHRVGNFLKF